ncbi:hypothetical protein F66182_11240 [Fusarium sp. NRRL 66182]|nr:hypothetical protein F66182_11240 [Fusarium sp. NRRL 66182]
MNAARNVELPNDNGESAALEMIPADDSQLMESLELPLDEFYFGNPAAWTFENLWNTMD